MGYSVTTFTIGDNASVGQVIFDLALTGPTPGYLKRTHVWLYLNGVVRGGAGGVDADGFTWTTNTRVQLKDYTPVAGDVLEFRRIIPKSSQYINFIDRSLINESNLDDAQLAALYLTHEILDGFHIEEFVVPGFAALEAQVDLNTDHAATVVGNPHAVTKDEVGLSEVTNNAQWHAGNDGTGSGLDADLLDGYHATAFQRPALTAVAGEAQQAYTDWDDYYTPGFFRGDSLLNETPYKSHTWQYTMVIRNSDTYCMQLAKGYDENDALTYRTLDNGVWSDWAMVFDTEHMGANSGLDADTVDGLHIKNPRYDTGAMVPSIGADGVMEVGQYFDFHHVLGNGDDYNVRLQTDGTTDGELFLKIEGALKKIWHAGNDGHGSGLDADLLDGFQASQFLRRDTDTDFASEKNFHIGSGQGAIKLRHYVSLNKSTITPYDGGDWAWTKEISFDADVGEWDIEGTPTVGANKIWHAGNDGHGSGLDADLLDGLEASQFIRSDAEGDNVYGDLAFSQGASINLRTVGGIGKTTLAMSSMDEIQVGHFDVPLEFKGFYPGPKYNENEMWHAGNDGSGSGLDADTVDGLHLPPIQAGDADKALSVKPDESGLQYAALVASDAGKLDGYSSEEFWLKEEIGKPNLLINGNFDIWQRATSSTADGIKTADRFNDWASVSTHAVSQQIFTPGQTDVPGNPKYYARTVVTSVADQYAYACKSQTIEGVHNVAGGDYTISFWAKANAAKDLCIIGDQFFGTGGSIQVNNIDPQIVTIGTTWAKYEATITFPSITGKTIGTDSYARVAIYMDAGSYFQGIGIGISQQSGTFDFAQIKLEQGAVATAFHARSAAEELALCERYYWQGYLAGQATGQQYGLASGNRFTAGSVSFPTTMRKIPDAAIITAPSYVNCTSYGLYTSPSGLTHRVTITANGIYQAYSGIYSASAEF